MAYYLGLDMGTSSVGWAVTDENYNLIHRHRKDLWGIREFEEAKTAVERRTQRVSRRRRQREMARIGLLKDYFHDEIQKVDPNFYQRLDNSKYFPEDKEEVVKGKNGIFADENYTDRDYFAEYPTIFHLRRELLNSKEPHDVRLLYLALLNMYKHRGHFLNATLGTDGENRKLSDVYRDFVVKTEEVLGLTFPQETDNGKMQEIMCSREFSRKRKAELLCALLEIDKKQKQQVALIECVLGLDKSVKQMYGTAVPDDFDKSVKVNFSDSSFEEKVSEVEELLDEEKYELILCMKELYDTAVLNQIMGDCNYLSEARVQEYEKHKEDLKLLKRTVKKYGTAEEYQFLFRSSEKASYSAYVHSVNSGEKIRRNMDGRSRDDLYTVLKKMLKNYPQENADCKYILEEIEKEQFLPKQLVSDNGVIPNQIHYKEMKKILENAEQYLQFLREKDESGYTVAERILKLFAFQIPYYVGPTSEKSGKNGGNGWVIRKESGKVLPWNIEEKIDMKATSEAFISRMVRRCTYLSDEMVLPKASLEYESFCVLNELNNLRIRGVKLPIAVKQDIYKELFERGKRVTRKQIVNYLKGVGILQEGEEDELTGMMDTFNSLLASYGKFKSILGEKIQEASCKRMVEQIIFWCTIYGDAKKFLKEQLEEKYGDVLTREQIKRILGFKLKDWGNLSKKFLELNGCDRNTGEVMSLIRMLWESDDNLMELLKDSRYTYRAELEEQQEKLTKTLTEICPEDLEGYYFSAPVKRMVWQTLLILKEIEKVMGEPPKRIFVEMTREHDERREMKDSRGKKFQELYKNIKDEEHNWKAEIEDAEKDGRIRSKKMYLYLTQQGRCMYTGQKIDLEDLFKDNLYDIDHIYPRCFVKDDNLDNNMVLVKKEINNDKRSEPLKKEIRDRQLDFWKGLHRKGFINDEKLKRLMWSEPFTDEQKAGFIARQLVETSQGTKGAATILKVVLPADTEIVYVKGRNVSEFRNKYNLLKSRSVNDFHHAQDAYLNIVVGNVYYMKFTNNPLRFVQSHENYHLGKMFEKDIVRGKYDVWIAESKKGKCCTIEKVKSVMAKNTPLLTRMSFEKTGKFTKENICSAQKVV